MIDKEVTATVIVTKPSTVYTPAVLVGIKITIPMVLADKI
jgi:hypothetical protein